MTFNKCTIKGKTYGDNGDDFAKAQAGLEEVSKFKHEYLRSRAYIRLSLSSPFPSVIVVQI